MVLSAFSFATAFGKLQYIDICECMIDFAMLRQCSRLLVFSMLADERNRNGRLIPV